MQIDYKLIIAVALGILLFLWYRKDHKQTEQFNQQIENNETRIDSLYATISAYELDQRVLNVQIKTLNDSIEYLNQLLSSNELQIKELKRKRNAKLNSINKYASDDIIKFLSNRYYGSKDSTSTTKDTIN
jgi:PIN domain nuclease of toxin-antitoxin system